MTRRRWIADEVHGDTAALTGANAAHLARVLRARAGQQFDISTGERVRAGVVTAVSEQRVEFRLGEEVASGSLAPLTLFLAVIKFDRFEWAIEKCTELGVGTVVPVIARRTESHLAQAAQKRMERWRRIAHEAAQQSRRISTPVIASPTKLKDVIERTPEGDRIFLNESEQQRSLADFFRELEKAGPVDLAIGPEGGWTSEEVAAFEAAGWLSASLGPVILRAETAAIAAVAVARILLP